ncbi:MAG: hypothetical protein NC087_03260 [Anaeroplasma bactoclasticum]|nr:hypothetical protein [Anaeroplasma bactoclasticum]MCM1556532.1 hypothetical protein [Anaeroplasma bactoclasticum]
MLKKIIFIVISLFLIFPLMSCTPNSNYYGLSVPLGILETDPFAEPEPGYEPSLYEYARVILSEISNSEYKSANGINVFADEVYPNKIVKYCYIELYGYDKSLKNFIRLNIKNLERNLGIPNHYFGRVFLEDKNQLMGSFSLDLNNQSISLLNHTVFYHLVEE